MRATGQARGRAATAVGRKIQKEKQESRVSLVVAGSLELQLLLASTSKERLCTQKTPALQAF